MAGRALRKLSLLDYAPRAPSIVLPRFRYPEVASMPVAVSSDPWRRRAHAVWTDTVERALLVSPPRPDDGGHPAAVTTPSATRSPPLRVGTDIEAAMLAVVPRMPFLHRRGSYCQTNASSDLVRALADLERLGGSVVALEEALATSKVMVETHNRLMLVANRQWQPQDPRGAEPTSSKDEGASGLSTSYGTPDSMPDVRRLVVVDFFPEAPAADEPRLDVTAAVWKGVVWRFVGSVYVTRGIEDAQRVSQYFRRVALHAMSANVQGTT